MTNSTQNTNAQTIADEAVSELRQTIRASWITSVKAIYAFGKAHSRASIEASLKAIDLNLTKKANEFTGAAKLGLSELYNGKWQVCDGQVSRYAKVCSYLNSRKIAVEGVEAALAGKTMTELVQSNSPKSEVTDEQFEQAISNIKASYSAQSLFDFGEENLPVSEQAGLVTGANLAVVVCDAAGSIIAMRGLGPAAEDKHFKEKVWSKAKTSEVVAVADETDLTAEAAALAEAA